MLTRRFWLLATLLFCLNLDARDWAKYPPVIERDAPVTLFAIGDIHGDYDRLVKLLTASGIIPSAPVKLADVAWNAGNAVLVVTGDMIDKGPKPVSVLRLLGALRTAAEKQGGQVILLSGNHEAEFLAGPDKKKAADFLADLTRNGIPFESVVACKGELGQMLCSLPFAARVGDWFFSHGGNTDGRSLVQLASDLRTGVDRDGFASKQLIGPASILEARLGEGNKWITSPNPKIGERELLAAYAGALGVKHIVQGHQPNDVAFADGSVRHAGEMFQRWGLLFLIDVGMSEGVGYSRGAVLRIAQRTAVALYPDGMETILWDERHGAAPDLPH